MITAILGIWGGIPLLGRRIIGYAGLALLVLLLLRWYSNKAFDKGLAEGRVSGAKDMAEKMEAEWVTKEADLAARVTDLDQQKAILGSQQEELNQSRILIRNSLNKIVAQNQKAKEQANVDVAAVPRNLLDGALRALSAELAAASGPPE